MPLNPSTQAKMGQLERCVLDILERDQGKPVNETSKMLLVQAGRHLQGLLSTLKQLDARLERRTLEALSSFFVHKRDKRAETAVVESDPVSRETGKTKRRTNK
jgi:hypothetical protein